ncbi:hypothetical protein WA577_005536, partial [Blastocystis sp. JDR]
VILPFCLGKEQLTSSAELAALEVGTKCRVVGEVLSVRKFAKTLTFIFVNTSNVFFDAKLDAYFYYDADAYDSHNACLNMRSILVKLFTKNKDEPAYQKLYAMLPSLKKRTLIEAIGTVDLSLRGEKILALESLCILKDNKTVTNAQRYITGLDVDFLNIHCENERNINFVNRKQNT